MPTPSPILRNSRRTSLPVVSGSDIMSWITFNLDLPSPLPASCDIFNKKSLPNALRLCMAPAPGFPDPLGAVVEAHFL